MEEGCSSTRKRTSVQTELILSFVVMVVVTQPSTPRVHNVTPRCLFLRAGSSSLESPQTWVLRAWNKQMGLTHPEKIYIYIFSCSWEVKLARSEVQGTGQLALLSPRASRELFGSSDSLLAALEFSLKTTLFWKELTLKRAPGGKGLREEAV